MNDDFKLTPEALQTIRKAESESDIIMTRFEPCLCGKLLDVATWQRKWHSGRWEGKNKITPGINYTDLVCEDCRKEWKGHPRIVCLSCHSLMGFYKPGKQSTGFVFEMHRHYHIADCPRCNPEIVATTVLEHERFVTENGVKTQANLDLLQEIETKTLQGKVEAAKLRQEYQDSQSHEN